MTLLATLEDFMSLRGSDPPLDVEHEDVMRALLALRIASDVVRRKTGRDFDRVETTITLDGPGTDSLLLPNPPIAEIVEVVSIDSAGSETEIALTDYRLDPVAGILRRTDGGTWPRGWRNITVELISGYLLPGEIQVDAEDLPELPLDLQGLVLQLASRLMDDGLSTASIGASGELKSVSMGIYAETYSTAADLAAATAEGLTALEESVLADWKLPQVA